MRVEALSDDLSRIRIVERGHGDRRAVLSLRFALITQERRVPDIEHAAEPLGASDWPVHRSRSDPERAFEVIDQLQRIARWEIELVHEGQNRQPVAAADLKELARPILNALGRVDDHDDT